MNDDQRLIIRVNGIALLASLIPASPLIIFIAVPFVLYMLRQARNP